MLTTGLLEYPTALNLTQYLMEEQDYVPWSAGLSNLAYLESMFTGASGYGDLKVYH